MAAPAPAPGPPPIALPARKHILEIGYARYVDYDYGDFATAWFILGLRGQQGIPTQGQYEDYCQRLLEYVRQQISPAAPRKSGVAGTMRRRVKIILMAIKTISGHSRMHIDHLNPAPDFPSPGDFPPGKTWAAQTGARIPAAGRPPLGDNVVAAIKSQRRDANIERQRRKVAYRKKQGDLPTAIEQAYNQRATHLDEWEFARRYSEGFTVRDCNDVPWTAQVIPTYKAAGNSLWHALSYQVNGAGTGPGVDDERLGLRGGRREKAWLYHYFTHVLHNPNHIRHRVYTYLQEADKAHRRRADYDHYSTDWGELSVLRCLATNNVDAGMAKAPIFKTIFQLISDFWDMEVIVFEAPRPLGRWDATYTWYVFGGGNWTANPRFTNPLSGNGQLFFVTDTKWEHFDAVRFDQNLGGIPGFDTEEVEWESRDGKYEIPFLNAGRHNLADIPSTDNGLPNDDAAFARYGRPADDPTFRLPDNHDLVLCFDNDRDAVETRAGYGEGRVPIFPPLDMMNVWGTQDPQPGDSRPTTFEPWLITSGYYREPPGDDDNVLQGRFLNENARLIDDKQQLFRAQGVVVTQEAEGEILRDPDENVGPFG